MGRCTAILAVCIILVRLTTALQACTSPDGPGVCRCSGTTVNCNGKNLAVVPDDIPASTTFLTLQHNHIVAIENTKIQHLQNLTTLYINNNEITTITSEAFTALHNLQLLSLNNNSISVVEPGSFQLLRELTQLNLAHNKLRASLSSDTFATLHKLGVLDLSHNNIKTLDHDIFEGLNQLSTLDVSHNAMTAIPSSVATLRSLQYFKAQHNEITDIQPGMFSNTYYVSELDISYNNITIIQAGTFANMTIDNDFRLYLSGNPIKQLDRYSFSNIVSAYSIYWFDMDFSNMQLEKIHELAFHNMLLHRWKGCDACQLYFNDNLLETLPSTLCNLDAIHLLYLHLDNNRWSCDCRMRDIATMSCSRLITCRYPPALSNRRFSSLSPENLVCSNPTIEHISPTVNQSVVGENVTMYCNATGFNRPTITWTFRVVSPSGIPANRQHHEISTTALDYNSTESSLTITHVQVTDQGNYTCHASNAAGEDSVSLHLTVISDTKQRQETPHLAAALGCAVGVFILWTILALIYFTHKRRQKTKHISSSRPSTRETHRGIQHSNPDEDEYDDVRVAKPRGKLTSDVQQRGFHDQRLTEMQGSESGEDAGHLYENPDHVYASLQDDAVTHGGEIERTGGGMARDVREQRRQQDQKARAIQSGESGENAGHTYQGLLHDNPDHDYTSLQGGHDGRTVSNGGGSDQGKGPKKGYKSAPGQATAGFGEDVSHQYQGLRLENPDHVYTSLRNGEATPGDQGARGRQVGNSDDHGHEYSQGDIAAEAQAPGSDEDLSRQYQNAPPDDDYHDYLQLGDD